MTQRSRYANGGLVDCNPFRIPTDPNKFENGNLPPSQIGLPQAHFRISSHPTQFDMTHSSANDIAALPPRHKFTTLDNGLVIIVRRSPFQGTVASRKHRVKMAL
jgi:hypothetical protein